MDRVEHTEKIRYARLEVRGGYVSARQAGCPPVVQDQSGNGGKTVEPRDQEGRLPAYVDVAIEVELPREIDWPFTEDLIGDVGSIACPRVPDIWESFTTRQSAGFECGGSA